MSGQEAALHNLSNYLIGVSHNSNAVSFVSIDIARVFKVSSYILRL